MRVACGATNEMARSVLKQNLGISQSEKLDHYDFTPIVDLKKSAEEDVKFLKNHEWSLRKVKVTGWVLDIDTGLLEKVIE